MKPPFRADHAAKIKGVGHREVSDTGRQPTTRRKPKVSDTARCQTPVSTRRRRGENQRCLTPEVSDTGAFRFR